MTLDRVVLTTGGTAGHIFPALAVAEELRARNPECALLFLGSDGPEKELARKHGIEFRELPAKGIMGKGLVGKMQGLLLVARGIFKARKELKQFKPDVVAGFGGYAGFSPVLAATMLNFPAAVHEQNSMPGVTNRLLGKLVDRVFLSFEDTTGSFPVDRIQRTGNPVRKEIFSVRSQAGAGRNLLILGGSQGARAINDAIIDMLPQLAELGVTLLHQAGPSDRDRVRQAYRDADADPEQVQGFLDDMASAYAWADLAVCRSGASTVFEIAAAGVPAIFVPFPHATHDHQTMNARTMEQAGAAQLLSQKDIAGLADMVRDLLGSPDTLRSLAEKAAKHAAPNAAAAITDGLEQLAAKAA